MYVFICGRKRLYATTNCELSLKVTIRQLEQTKVFVAGFENKVASQTIQSQNKAQKAKAGRLVKEITCF